MWTLPDDIFDLIGRGLPIANGGTGATYASRAFYNLVSALSTVTTASSSYYIPMQYSTSGRRISYENLASAIKNTVASTLTPQDIGACKIQTGTYTGTGSYGSGSANHITFSFPPVLVGVSNDGEGRGYSEDYREGFNISHTTIETRIDVVSQWPTSYTDRYGFGYNLENGYAEYSSLHGKKSGNTIYWYSTVSAAHQFNENKHTYKWFAIG